MSHSVNVGRAVGVLAACYLPGFISAVAVDQIRDDFPVSSSALGVAFATYWGVAAVTSVPAAGSWTGSGPCEPSGSPD